MNLSNGSDEQSLPSPTYNNSIELEPALTIRVSMAGTMRTYIKTPVRTRLVMTFSDICASDRFDIESFLFDNFDNEITLTDHNDVEWLGFINQDGYSFEEDKDNRFTFNLIFEGVKQ